MALEDYRSDVETCRRCSACKFIPLEKAKGFTHINVCPSISRYDFHTYSGGGRMVDAAAMLADRLTYSDKLLEVVYNCQMCGACDVSCKYAMDMEVLEPISEFRIRCVETNHTLPALDKVISLLRKNGTMVPGTAANRAQWADGLKVKNIDKEKAQVLFFAGCRTAFNKDMWNASRAAVNLLLKAGVDIGIAGEKEVCCGCRAYQMGYKADFLKQAESNMKLIKQSGVRTLVTGCAECYHAFKVLYDKFNLKGDLEVLHTTEYFDRLIQAGKLKPKKAVAATVTYQDPCYLGRLGEKYIHWKGRAIPGHIRIFDPPKEFRRGTYGVYEPPRNILKSIPGLSLVEMDRTREYAWCCGAGGGVTDSNPGFAEWTAGERMKEAQETGAGMLATACPGCNKNFNAILKKNNSQIKVYDIAELLEQAI